jgi:hypothetical protein
MARKVGSAPTGGRAIRMLRRFSANLIFPHHASVCEERWRNAAMGIHVGIFGFGDGSLPFKA